MNSAERLDRAIQGINCYFPIVGALHRRQRAALHVVDQCAEKAYQAGDIDEAARLYYYLYTKYQSLFHEPFELLSIPDYSEPPVDVDRWVTQEMFRLADIATTGRASPTAARTLYMALPHYYGASVIGDLDEEFFDDVLPRFGRDFAVKWYRRQVVFSIANFWIVRPIGAIWRHVKDIAIEAIRSLIR